jgi:hypothetical protein
MSFSGKIWDQPSLHTFIRIWRQSGPGEPGGVSRTRFRRPPPAPRRLPAPPARAATSPALLSRRRPAASLRSARPGLYGRPAAHSGSPGRLVLPGAGRGAPGSSIRAGPPDDHRAAAPVVPARARPSSGPGAGSPAGRAYMTFMSVNGTSPRRGPRQRHRPWVTLYRRVCIAFGNLTRQAGRRRVPGVSHITEMRPIRNPPETYPGDRDNIVSMPLTWGDAPLLGLSGAGAKPG